MLGERPRQKMSTAEAAAAVRGVIAETAVVSPFTLQAFSYRFEGRSGIRG